MDKNSIIEILRDWNLWERELESGRERKSYSEQCMRFLKPNVILALIGARRSGKSYLMRQLAKNLIKTETERKNIVMVNFEDQRFTEFYPELLEEVYEAYIELMRPCPKPYVFLDEVHNVPGWERWVRTMHELGKAKIIISGSSSKLLSGELATVLTGRHLDVYVFPLSFREFLEFRGLEIRKDSDAAYYRREIKGYVKEYFDYGGFPEVVLSQEKKQILLKYFEDFLTKDVEKRYRVRKTEKLRSLARFYLTNISNPVTFNSLKNYLGIATDSIEKFSSYLEETGIIFFVKRFSFSFKEQEKSARKVYSVDTGIANAVGFRSSENAGRLMENVVAAELKRRAEQNPNMEFYYWKDQSGKEVDFVIKDGLKVSEIIQTCWDVSDPRTRKREIRPLISAMKKLKLKRGIVVTQDLETEETIKGKKVVYKPVWKWLLEA